MNARSTIAVPSRLGHRRSLAVAGAVLALGAAVAVLVFAFDSASDNAGSSLPAKVSAAASPVAQTPRLAAPISSLTPARLAAGALGTGYALPTGSPAPTMAAVLASMSPQTRSYTKAIMSLTFTELAAGAGGHP